MAHLSFLQQAYDAYETHSAKSRLEPQLQLAHDTCVPVCVSITGKPALLVVLGILKPQMLQKHSPFAERTGIAITTLLHIIGLFGSKVGPVAQSV
jgi:hypothetical protein